jgi:hypothetical protein
MRLISPNASRLDRQEHAFMNLAAKPSNAASRHGPESRSVQDAVHRTNRYFKKHHPLDRLLASAEGAYYTTVEGQRLFDCLSGLWCSSLGHGPARIVKPSSANSIAPTTFQVPDRQSGHVYSRRAHRRRRAWRPEPRVLHELGFRSRSIRR